MVTPTSNPETLKVLFDGGCPLCRREIAHVKGLAEKNQHTALCFIDISETAAGLADPAYAHDRARLLARFHVERADGSRMDGAPAFIAMWERLPGWRWLARIARLPGMPMVFEFTYKGFLLVRPSLQRVAVFLENTSTPANEANPGKIPKAQISAHLLRELRSDHAGETGAIYIYQGIAAVARRRGWHDLLDFTARHGETESEHLRLIEAWLPVHSRSRLLGPWRLAGWLTGALPALISQRAVYATIAAVETFVDHHYQQQIDYLNQNGGPEGLLSLLQRCQMDECHHRDEANLLAGEPASWTLRAWCWLVGFGSAAAVKVARRF